MRAETLVYHEASNQRESSDTGLLASFDQGTSPMRDGVEAVLQRIRPHLLADGCDVVLMDVTDDGVVRIALAGKTALCPMSHMTLTVGIDAVLRDAVPGVTKVEIVRTP